MSFRTLTMTAVAGLAALSLLGCDPEKAAGGDEPKDNKPVAGENKKPEESPVEYGELQTEPKEGDEVAVLETDKGKIVLMFHADRAPNHVENFKSLAKSGFYDGTRFHRTIEGFMIQGGDPNSKDLSKSDLWGTGGNVVDGSEKMISAEFNDIPHERGVLSMARSNDPNSASSQFFIVQTTYPSLDGQYTAFGRVVSGLEVVDEIVKTPVKDRNGTVFPSYAAVVKKVEIKTWPLE